MLIPAKPAIPNARPSVSEAFVSIAIAVAAVTALVDT
jgi:hypothetical protein